ncbi:hypothetical protein JKG47_07075 [Acidithiobacillus sp. MC6.1]|nr:hypothetical protein [Acidithiobacillus sp. MC6.1]
MKINVPFLRSLIVTYPLYFIVAAVVAVYLVGAAIIGGGSGSSHVPTAGPDMAGATGPFGKDNSVSGVAAARRQINEGLLGRRASDGVADTYNNH